MQADTIIFVHQSGHDSGFAAIFSLDAAGKGHKIQYRVAGKVEICRQMRHATIDQSNDRLLPGQ